MTNKPSWTDLLELPPDAVVEVIGESSPPSSEIGQGYSLESIALDSLEPSFSTMQLDARPSADLGLSIDRWDLNPGIVRVTADVEGAPLEVRAGHHHAHDPGDVVFDTRTEPAVVVYDNPAGALVVHIRAGHIALARIREPSASALSAFERAPKPAAVALPDLPPLGDLLEGAASPEWLATEYRERSESSSLVDRFAALGLVARLWEPTTAADRKMVMEWLRTGRGTSASRVADWLAAHGGAAAAASVGERVLAAAVGLLDRVSHVDELAVGLSDAEMARVIAGIRLDRDDLESAVVAMHLAGADTSAAREAAAAIDDRARVRLTTITHLGAMSTGSERLSATARELPDAWWVMGVR